MPTTGAKESPGFSRGGERQYLNWQANLRGEQIAQRAGSIFGPGGEAAWGRGAPQPAARPNYAPWVFGIVVVAAALMLLEAKP